MNSIEHSPSFQGRSSLVLQQLARIVASPSFEKSPRRQKLLAYLVEQELSEPGAEITERMLATNVYGRSAEFTPAEDSIVRVEISRLRSALETYYMQHGRDDSVLVSIPKGSYSPVIWLQTESEDRTPEETGTPEGAALPASAGEAPNSGRLSGNRRWLWSSVAGLLVILGTISIWRAFRPPQPASGFLPVTSLPGMQVDPSLSPDGSSVVFAWAEDSASHYDLYRKPLQGDSLTRLTSSEGSSRSAAWSPDGRSIAFLRGLAGVSQGVVVMSAEGGHERLITTIHTTVAGIAWTPDSRYLIVPDSPPGGGPLALYRVSASTGERRQVTENGSYFHPSVSPDGHTLAYANDSLPGRMGVLWLLPLGSDFLPAGPPEQLPATTGADTFWPTWSGSGDSLLFTRNIDDISWLFRYRLNSGEVSGVKGTGPRVRFGRELADGRILVARRRQREFIARVPARVHGVPEPLFPSHLTYAEPAISPDGKKIYFRSLTGTGRNGWISGPDGTGAVPVSLPAGLSASRPYWAPDSKALYLQVVADPGKGGEVRIWRVDVSGNRPPSATPVPLGGGQNGNPSVSRDGKWLYFSSTAGGELQIRRAPISDGLLLSRPSPERITMDRGFLDRATFAEESLDGKSLYYSLGAGIWRMSLDDRSRVLIQDGPPALFRVAEGGIYFEVLSARPEPIQFRPFGPDGKAIAVMTTPHRTWAPVPGEDSLAVTVVQLESNIDLYMP